MTTTTGFEGPEKLLEIWFAPSPADVPEYNPDGKNGLRKVDRAIWEEMLDIVQCKVLSVIEGVEIDAYLLSESSLFISPHRLILKTCGTTLNLYGLPRILEIARDQASLPNVYRFFYSRKSFMFPDRQSGPHKDWAAEIKYLEDIFKGGSAYTVGKVNGDHWLLYMTEQSAGVLTSGSEKPLPPLPSAGIDYTIEILMTHLDPTAASHFASTPDPSEVEPSSHAQSISASLGIKEIFPPALTSLDAYSFSPCGYSSNALLKFPRSGDEHGEGYYTIHVTPEEAYSYASFECNVPLSAAHSASNSSIPDLRTLISRIVSIFKPGKLSLTLFISSEHNTNSEDEEGETTVEAAQKAFRSVLSTDSNGEIPVYKRTDKINYEFGDYDLAFASFECSSRIQNVLTTTRSETLEEGT